MTDAIKKHIAQSIPRDLLIDLLDVAASRALEAHRLIHDNTDLTGSSARALEGQARFRLMEKGFQDACEKHGGLRLAGDVIPGPELRCFQPFMRFGSDEPGVVLGLAAMPAKSEIPAKNRSRLAGVAMNCHLSPELNLDGTGARLQPGDIFVLLLFARDPARAGYVEEVAIGVVDATYNSFLFYESVENFIAAYAPDSPVGGPAMIVKLKEVARTFVAPEGVDDGSDSDTRDEA